jgi:hypothetical protein
MSASALNTRGRKRKADGAEVLQLDLESFVEDEGTDPSKINLWSLKYR